MKNLFEDLIVGRVSAKEVRKQIAANPALKGELQKQMKTALDKKGELIKRLEREVYMKLQANSINQAKTEMKFKKK